MKKIIYLLSILLLCGCGSDNTTENQNSFAITLTPSATNVVVDESFTITVAAGETIKSMGISLDNFATGAGNAVLDFGSSKVLTFNFDSLGQKTITINATNNAGAVSQKQIVVNVTRGNAIKINGLQLISFYDINTSWDPEYGTNNINRLADLQFGFIKTKLNNYYNGSYSDLLWHLSTTLPNQGTMTWDLSTYNLYLKPEIGLQFGLADVDEVGGGQDLLNGPPYEKTISFTDYIQSKPTTITYSYPEINLEFKLLIDWVN